VILAGVCGLALTPFLRWGSPSGHDFEFHLYSWMDVLAQWQQGGIYPRWAGLAHWGYGEARFLFYPPASWTLGAALGAMLPWGIVPCAYCWIVLTAAGASMYALARQWVRPDDALFAAVFYALNPYHLVIVYWRSAYAELLAGALLPLVVLCVTRLNSLLENSSGASSHPQRLKPATQNKPFITAVNRCATQKQDRVFEQTVQKAGVGSTLWLSLALAGAWLINAPAALMIHYSVAGLGVLMAVREKSARLLIKTALAVLLGAGLASFYLVPAIYEESWVNISQLLSPGVTPQDNFLFTTLADADHNRFNMLVSLVALAEIVVLAFVMWFARRKRSDMGTWWLLSVWGAATAFVMLPASSLLWEHLPKFRYVQLPFRWLLCMNVPLAMLLAIATSQSSEDLGSTHPSTITRSAIRPAPFIRWTARGLVSGVLLGVIVVAGYRTQAPWWDAWSDIELMSDSLSNGAGYEGTDEYVPVGADPYEIKPELPRVSDESGGAVSVQTKEWNATEKHFVAHSDTPRKLTVRLFNYPAWELTVNGERVQAETTEETGLMVIPVPAGDDDVLINFGRTPDRTAGGIVSLISLCVFGVTWIKTRSLKIAKADA
jgi:hypothetical protein